MDRRLPALRASYAALAGRSTVDGDAGCRPVTFFQAGKWDASLNILLKSM